MAPEIELEKLISDSLYLDNQAHAVVARMRDMDSGTKSQLRRLYNAVRRAVRAPEAERQHHFVMLRARLAYTIARHSLRSLDALERLLLQVTRRNDAKWFTRDIRQQEFEFEPFQFFSERKLLDHMNQRQVYGLKADASKPQSIGNDEANDVRRLRT